MKEFIELSVDNLEILQGELLDQLKEIRPDIFVEDISKQVIPVGYSKETTTPALKEFEEHLSLRYGNLVNKTFWVTGPRAYNWPHIDGSSKFIPSVKLMFPVINCKGTLTTWFDYDGPVESVQTELLEYSFPTDDSLLQTTNQLTLLKPIWARVDKPHSVFNYTKNVRVICSYVFKDQNKLLELFAQNK